MIAAVVAAIASLANVFVGTWGTFALENKKWSQAREDDVARRLNEAVAGFSYELATAVQRAAWLTWVAQNDPSSLSQEELDIYNTELRAIFPKLFSSQVLIASYDKATYEKTGDLLTRFSALDNKIALAASRFRESPEDALAALRSCYPEARQLVASLPDEYTSMVKLQAPNQEPHTR